MRVPDLGFAGVLERLERIRQELVATSSPERVHELRAEADALVARGEQILGRPAGSPPAPGAPEPGASEPGAAEPSPPEAPAPDPRAADREAADPGAAHPDGAAPADPATRPLPGRRPADGEQTAVLTRS